MTPAPRILDGPLDRLAGLSPSAMVADDPAWLLAALDALPASAIAWADGMIARLAAGRSPSLRERAAYLRRQGGGQAGKLQPR